MLGKRGGSRLDATHYCAMQSDGDGKTDLFTRPGEANPAFRHDVAGLGHVDHASASAIPGKIAVYLDRPPDIMALGGRPAALGSGRAGGRFAEPIDFVGERQRLLVRGLAFAGRLLGNL